MKITGFKLATLSVPLSTPFKTALRTVSHVEDVVLIIETDTGHQGYGEAPPTKVITGDTRGTIITAIRTSIMPALIGMEVTNLNEIIHIIQNAVAKNTSAKAAVEIAIYDLYAQYYQAPLYKILGGGEPHLRTDITISVDTVEKMVSDSLDAVAAGYEILKVKVGNDIDLDIARVKSVFAAVKDRALIRLDVNQGWTASQTVRTLDALDTACVTLELVEQPVKSHDLDGMKYITERVNTPIMADESAFGPKEVIELIGMKAADIINIKLMKTGGISNALKIIDIAEIHNVECMMGCMLESSISVTAAAHVAVSRPRVITKIDLDGPLLCTFDPADGVTHFKGPDITIGDRAGLGIKSIRNLTFLDE